MSDDVREWLAAETAALHAELDQIGGAFDLGNEAGCDALLAFFAHGVSRVEGALDLIGADRFWPDYTARRRAHLLPAVEAEIEPLFATEAASWGALYVLEGSRLGAKVLSRRSRILGGHPYFGSGSSREWPEFLRRLGEADDRLGNRKAMAEGAIAAFRAFFAPGAEHSRLAEADHPTNEDARAHPLVAEPPLSGRLVATRRLSATACAPAKSGCEA